MPRRIQPLTDSEIKKAKSGSKQQTIFDGGGLFLLVSPSGGKLWRFKYRYAGKDKLMSFGSYPELSLADARQVRADARKLLAQNIDPLEFRKSNKALNKELTANTFEAVAREWHHKFSSAGKWSPNHAADILHRLEKDIFPPLGTTPISEIKPKDLLKVLERIASRGALDTAHRIRHHCGMIFRYSIVTERAERDIAADLKGALPAVKNGHHAALTTPKTIAPLLRAISFQEIGIKSPVVYYVELNVLPRQHRIQLWKKPAGSMNRKANPDFTLGGVGYQQPLGHQLGQQVSAGPLFQSGFFYD